MLIALLLQAAAPPPIPAGPPAGPSAAPQRRQPAATMVVEPAAMAIASFDADRDGRTDKAELRAGLAATFHAADPQGTGRIGYLAFADWAQRWLGDRNALPSPFEIDTDGDNAITPAELEAGMLRIFDRLDVDRDGFVTRAETLTIRAGVGGGPEGGRGRGRGPRR